MAKNPIIEEKLKLEHKIPGLKQLARDKDLRHDPDVEKQLDMIKNKLLHYNRGHNLADAKRAIEGFPTFLNRIQERRKKGKK